MSVCLYAWYEQQSENRNFFNPYSHIYFEVFYHNVCYSFNLEIPPCK